jgi:hypothetical protein
MLLELNEALLEGEPRTLSLMAREGQLTCLSGGSSQRRLRWLEAMMGFVPVLHGYISIDGEPLSTDTAKDFRRLMAFAPAKLPILGEVKTYEPPSVQGLFSLRANRTRPISNGILGEEMRRVGIADEAQAQLIAVAVLLGKPILLVDYPPVDALAYLLQLARQGRIVVVTSDEAAFHSGSDLVVDI